MDSRWRHNEYTIREPNNNYDLYSNRDEYGHRYVHGHLYQFWNCDGICQPNADTHYKYALSGHLF